MRCVMSVGDGRWKVGIGSRHISFTPRMLAMKAAFVFVLGRRKTLQLGGRVIREGMRRPSFSRVRSIR